MILTYELSDDIGVEHEVEFATEQAAANYIAMQADYLVWWTLTDENGDEVASSLAY